MTTVLLYVEADKDVENTILKSIRTVEGVNDAFLIPGTSNLYHLNTCQGFDGSSIASKISIPGCVISRPLGDDNIVAVLAVSGMTCKSCVKLIESTVGKLNGINNVKVSLPQSEAFIEYQPALIKAEKLCMVVRNLGFDTNTKFVINSDGNCNNALIDEITSSKQMTVGIEGMTCNSCVKLIENTVGAVDGIAKISVSLEKKEAVMEYDPSIVNEEGVKKVIEDNKKFKVIYVKGLLIFT